jgi:hypothetical protein
MTSLTRRHRGSPLRVARLLLVVIPAGGGIVLALWQRPPSAAALSVHSSFEPYVDDVTLTPTYAFEVPSANRSATPCSARRGEPRLAQDDQRALLRANYMASVFSSSRAVRLPRRYRHS